jgi:hypothetical protein
VQYYYSRADLGLKVTRTVACDEADLPIVANAVTPTVRYSADRAGGLARFSVAGLRGPLSDSDLKFEFQEDGRLKGVNATTTGQGETILKSASVFFGAIMGMDGGSAPMSPLCAEIKTWNGGKPVTLGYEGDLDPGRPVGSSVTLKPDPASAFYAEKLLPAVGEVCAKIVDAIDAMPPVEYAPQNGDVMLPMRQPGLARIEVTAGAEGRCGPVIWSGDVPAGQLGRKYELPVPKAAVFGKQTFAVAVNESGSLSSISDAHASGVGQGFNAAAAGLDLVDGETDAQKAARIKAEADLIAAQTRLVACRADWEGCK